MAPSRSRNVILPLLAAGLLPQSAWSFECKNIVAQGQQFNLEKLGGPHIVHWEQENTDLEALVKYNFTIDLCNALKWHKGGSSATECHHGARVCALREIIDLNSANSSMVTPIDIAGTYKTYNGREIDAKFELLRNSKSNSDASREGLRAELHGGRHPFEDKKEGIDQRAIIEFVCDTERTGLEGDEKDDGEHEEDPKDDDKKDDGKKEQKLRRREDDNGKCQDSKSSLRFCGYAKETPKKDSVVQTLRLEWRTKYACENVRDVPSDDKSSHWGFFGWFFIM